MPEDFGLGLVILEFCCGCLRNIFGDAYLGWYVLRVEIFLWVYNFGCTFMCDYSVCLF